MVQRLNASFSVALVMVFAVPFTAAQKHPASEDCGFRSYGYEQMLDAYFAHARGSSPSAVVLRVYGGLGPEYEIVIDPNISTHRILRYTARKPIWGKAFDDYMRNHRTAAGYVPQAIKVPVSKHEFEIPRTKLQELVAGAKTIDPNCENRPFNDSKGNQVVVLDAPYLELIVNSGRSRARVTDTEGMDVISQNPALLRWALDVENATRELR